MMGLGISYGFIAGVIGVASRLVASGRMGAKAGRKVIHVLVGHWWFLAMALIRQPWVALIGPGSFVIINALIIRLKLLPALSGRDKNYGTVYYPLSLLVLVVLVWYGDLNAWIGALGMMIMCWGDAAAALVGEAWTARRANQVHGPGSGGSTRAGPDRPSPTPPPPGTLSSPAALRPEPDSGTPGGNGEAPGTGLPSNSHAPDRPGDSHSPDRPGGSHTPDRAGDCHSPTAPRSSSPGKKTLAGSLAMGVVSFIVALPLVALALPEAGPGTVLAASATAALTGSVLEYLTPLGLDNISVPLGTAGILWILFL